MKTFKNGRSHKVSIYIPGTSGAATAADNEKFILSAADMLSEMFGGASANEVRGFWKSAEYGLIEEKTTVIYSSCTLEALEQNENRIYDFAMNMKKELEQEAVSVEIDSELFLI